MQTLIDQADASDTIEDIFLEETQQLAAAATAKAQGDWEEALRLYRALQEQQSHDWELYRNLGDVLLNLQSWEESIEAYQQSLSLYPDFDWNYHNIAVAFSNLGKIKEADQFYEKLLHLNPSFCRDNLSDFQVQQQWGDFAYRRENWQEAVDAYHQSIALNAEACISYVNLAKALSRLEQWDRAAAMLQQAAQIEPNRMEVHNLLGEVLANLGRWEESIAAYRNALSLKSVLSVEPSKLQLDPLGVDLDGQLDSDKMRVHDSALLPEDFDWHFYVNYHIDLQDLQTYEAAVDHWMSYGREEGRFSSERAFFEDLEHRQLHLPADFSSDAYLFLNPDVVQEYGHNHYQAIQHYLMFGIDEQREYHLMSANAHESRAEFLIQLGDLDEAIVAYQRALELAPYKLQLLGKLEQTLRLRIDQWTKFPEQGSQSQQAKLRSLLGSILVKQNRTLEALTEYHIAVQSCSDSSDAHHGLGLALSKLERFDEAILSLQRAIALNKQDASTYEALGEALAAQERVDEASIAYRKSLELADA